MTKMNPKSRRTKVQNLDTQGKKLSTKELKKVRGGAKRLDATSQSGGPTAAQNKRYRNNVSPATYP
jgi:hypothetical protein